MADRNVALNLLFHALAEPTRRAILERLMRGRATVSELAEPLPFSLPTVTQHLSVLEKGGLVRSEKVGRVRTCHIEPEALREAETWLSRQRAIWEGRLDRLDTYLETMKAEEPRDEES